MVIRINKIQHLISFLLLFIALSYNVTHAATGATTLSYMNMTTEPYSNVTNGMEIPENFSCQTFNCSGYECYENQNDWEECPSAHMYCEFYRTSNDSYWAGCSDNCAGTDNICWNASQTMCTMECCNTTLCLMLNGTIQELRWDYETTEPMTEFTTMETTPMPTTAATTIGSGNRCRVVSCTGDTCYQSQAPEQEYCTEAEPYCKLEKETSSNKWTSGCDSSCNTVSSGCSSSGSASTCIQECCQATTDSCLKLDGQEYLLGSASMAQSMKVMIYAVAAFTLANQFSPFSF
ncbi:uncharacterized protein LOC134338271 [Mobula hypostoma]|uniref:uncharacterized protein LOC134338271 n=1 Tax=Mobula hypostoma TaxID=723540 RepID=UPI002FC3169B